MPVQQLQHAKRSSDWKNSKEFGIVSGLSGSHTPVVKKKKGKFSYCEIIKNDDG